MKLVWVFLIIAVAVLFFTDKLPFVEAFHPNKQVRQGVRKCLRRCQRKQARGRDPAQCVQRCGQEFDMTLGIDDLPGYETVDGPMN